MRHGLSHLPEYSLWLAMTKRCRHGSRGKNSWYKDITVSERWLHDFAAFYADMGPRPTTQHSIDRIDNSKGYEPSNCRWATAQQQCLNRGLFKTNTSGYRGVNRVSSADRWQAQIGHYGRNIYIGCFIDPLVAAWFYDQYAIQLYGDDAKLNFDYA
jgi:hypothetical protein